jgi:hypothetical protein
MTNDTDSEPRIPVASVDDMAAKKTAKARVVGDRIRALREALNWGQSKLLYNATQQGFKLERVEISKVETYRNQLSSHNLRASFAAAFLLSPAELDAYLGGGLTTEEVVALAGQRTATVRSPASHPVGGADAAAVRAGDEMGVMLALKAIRDQSTTYPKLTLAVAYWADNGKTWSRDTVAAAEHGHFEGEGCDAWASGEWAKALDRLEAVLRHAKVTSPERRV